MNEPRRRVLAAPAVAIRGRRRPHGTPEADLQRQIVRALRLALPPGAIVHHSAHEVRSGGPAGRRRQAIAVGMGVHAGFPDLVVIAQRRVLFLEVKAPRGRLGPEQEAFRDAVRAQGFGYAVVRSIDHAFDALAAHGFRTRISGGAAR